MRIDLRVMTINGVTRSFDIVTSWSNVSDYLNFICCKQCRVIITIRMCNYGKLYETFLKSRVTVSTAVLVAHGHLTITTYPVAHGIRPELRSEYRQLLHLV